MNWRKISDNKPNDGDYVMVYDGYGCEFMTYTNRFGKEEWKYEDCDLIKYTSINDTDLWLYMEDLIEDATSTFDGRDI